MKIKSLLVLFLNVFFVQNMVAQTEKAIDQKTFNQQLCERISVYAPDSIIAKQNIDKAKGIIALNLPSDSLENEGIALSDQTFFMLLGQKLNYPEEIYNFYNQRACQSAWFSMDTKLSNADTLMMALNEVESHGLPTKAYHLDTLFSIYNNLTMRLGLNKAVNGEQLLDFEILMTDAAIAYAHDLRIGRTNPADVEFEYSIKQDTAYVADDLASALNTQTLNEYYMGIAPHFEQYQKIKIVLDDYVEKSQNYDWTIIPAGESIKPNMQDPRLPLIRQHLDILDSSDDSGTLIAIDSAATIYDSFLEARIKDFQLRNGLNPDGEIGAGTLEQLNISPQERIEDLSINLERWRWMPREIGERYIIVNIAGFFMQMYDADTVSFTKKVVVGKTYTKTPVFSDKIEYIEFNPTWSVPYSIKAGEILPKLRSNPGYLNANDMVLLSGNKKVNPYSVNWENVSPRNFPYGVRQEPGSKNALGTMKFIFPNQHNVYLHDTPSKDKFNEYERAFSHGCVRLQNPIELAEHLLAPEYDINKIQKILASSKTQKVFFSEPVPIYIGYWSVWVDEQGNPYFMKDIYKRDEPVKNAYFAQ